VKIDVFTLFPEWFEWFSSQRHVSNVLAAGSHLELVNPRDHTPLSGGQVDDTPFGGGAGMVLRVDVMDIALRAHYGVDPLQLRRERRVIALAPGGRLLDEELAQELAGEPALTLLCGRYEGFDERILEHLAGEVVSIGRYVLSGGELAAMVLCDAVLRKLPGALGHERSAAEESSASRSRATRSTPTTRALPSIAAGVCPMCCCRGTTSRSSAGAWSAAANAVRRQQIGRAAERRLVWWGGLDRRSATIAARAGRDVRFGAYPRTTKGALHPFIVMSSVIATIERAQLRRVPAFAPGDRVKVHFQVIEGARSRVQVFEGVVIKRQGHGARETFTVRKQSFGSASSACSRCTHPRSSGSSWLRAAMCGARSSTTCATVSASALVCASVATPVPRRSSSRACCSTSRPTLPPSQTARARRRRCSRPPPMVPRRSPRPTVDCRGGSQEQADAADHGSDSEDADGAVAVVDAAADAGATDTSSDAGDAEEGVTAGDDPA